MGLKSLGTNVKKYILFRWLTSGLKLCHNYLAVGIILEVKIHTILRILPTGGHLEKAEQTHDDRRRSPNLAVD